MPIYEYRCSSCSHELEALQKFSDAPLTSCPACGKDSLIKKISAAGFQLKGSGWYATDFKGSGSKPVAKDKAAGDAKSDAKSDTKSDAKSDTNSDTKSDSKSDTKSDSKSDTKSNTKSSGGGSDSGGGTPGVSACGAGAPAAFS